MGVLCVDRPTDGSAGRGVCGAKDVDPQYASTRCGSHLYCLITGLADVPELGLGWMREPAREGYDGLLPSYRTSDSQRTRSMVPIKRRTVIVFDCA